MVCTVLPTYNEGDNIEPLIRGVLAHALTPHMVLVVDDDSPDGTWQVVERLMGELNRGGEVRVALLRRRHESGLTSAIQRGIDTAIHTFGAGIVTWMDCDLDAACVRTRPGALSSRTAPTWSPARAGYPAAPTSPTA